MEKNWKAELILGRVNLEINRIKIDTNHLIERESGD